MLPSFFNSQTCIGGNLAMNNNQIRFRGSGDQNHRINYTNENGLDGLHIQGNKGVEIATETDGTVMTVKDGNVGIGEENPSNTLSVWGGGDSNDDGLNNSFSTFVRNSHGAGSGLRIRAGASQGYPLLVQNNYDEDILVVRSYGKVGIGTTAPDRALTVNGIVKCKEVEITDNVPSSDYVFEEDYELMSIDEVEAYITQHKHLPDVPGAEEFKKNGYKAGDMDDMLLKKIEELTLYIIEQEKRIEELDKRINDNSNQ